MKPTLENVSRRSTAANLMVFIQRLRGLRSPVSASDTVTTDRRLLLVLLEDTHYYAYESPANPSSRDNCPHRNLGRGRM